jgi:hypothetical protein
MAKHPFNEGTQLAQIFTLLSDGEWHCGKHELPGTQPAKPIQIIRQHGFDIINDTIYCDICRCKTVHRKLTSTEPVKDSFIRIHISTKIRARVLKLHKNRESITMREMVTNLLEVDHRFPQVRWTKDEKYDENMSDKDLLKKFQLLTREHNLWKSRYCEKCFESGERGTFIGIKYFAIGGPNWDTTLSNDDEKGCYGCFWFDPDFWRNSINKKLK